MSNQYNASQQVEVPSDPTTQAIHRVLSRVYGDNGSEVDATFLDIRKKCKERLRLSDIVSAPLLQEITNDEATIVNAIKNYPGFFVRNDLVKQHHDYMPHNAVLLRDLPAKYSNNQLIELFQTLVSEDGTACPMPIPEKIRSDQNTWLAVFASVEDAQKALLAVRAKVLDGKNIRAVLRNESTRVQQFVLNQQQKRDGMAPPMYNNAPMGNVPPSFPNPMYGQTTVIAGPQAMYYAPPAAGGYPYYPYQPSPYAMSPYGMHVQYSLPPQSPYGAPPTQYGYDMSMYGVPVSPTMQNNGNNMYTNGVTNTNNVNNNANINNNNNKLRRNNQYANNNNGSNGNSPNYHNNNYNNNNYNNNNYNNNNNRNNQQKTNQPRYSKAGEDVAMASPSGVTATEVAISALESQPSIPRSFSADAEDAPKQPELAVPVISVPTTEASPVEVAAVVPAAEENTTPVATANEEAAKGASEADANAEKDDKSPAGRKDGKRGEKKDGKREGDRRNNARDGKGQRQDKDKDTAVKKERKTPPVHLNLEKDFPTLQLGADNSKTSGTGKVAFNYANALKKPTDESPKPATPVVPSKPAPVNNNNNNNNNQSNKKEARSSSKGSSPNPATSARTGGNTPAVKAVSEQQPAAPVTVPIAPAMKKEEVPAPVVVVAPVVTLPEPVKVSEKVVVITPAPAPISPSVETPAVETEQPAGAKKAFSFLDALRAKK